MKSILCIGEALIDMICTDKGSPLSEGEHFLRKAGGAPANVAAAIAALGGNVQLAASVGADPFGDHLASVMRSFGVGTKYLMRDPDRFTTLAFVSLMENGERDFYFNRGADAGLSVDDLSGLQMDDYGIVHFGSATAFLPGELFDTYHHLLQQALQSGVLVSFDPNFRQLLFGNQREDFAAYCRPYWRQAGFFKVSDEEAMLLTGQPDLTSAVRTLQAGCSGVFAVTLGKAGTLMADRERQANVPSIDVSVTDTTGAGDAFTGAMLYQLSRVEVSSLSWEAWTAMAANANIAGARTCEHMGAMEAFRHLKSEWFQPVVQIHG